MQRLRFGRYEYLQIRNGEVVLPDTWVRLLRFGAEDAPVGTLADEFELKEQIIQLFEYVRAVATGEIRCLEVRHGLPISMEIEHRPEPLGDRRSV
jgi:hypothetical protein